MRPKNPNPDSEPNIKRIDSQPKAKKQTHGFQVHFTRGETKVSKMFSDGVYGGKEPARRAARKFKRTVVADLPDRVYRGFGTHDEAPATTTLKPGSSQKTGRSSKKS